MVQFEIAKYSEEGFYTETDLTHESNLVRLFVAKASHPSNIKPDRIIGRIKIHFEVGPSIYLVDELNGLMHNLHTTGLDNIKKSKPTSINYFTHYGNVILQPLDDYLFISGNITLGNQEQVLIDKAFICQKKLFVDGLEAAYSRYKEFLSRFKGLTAAA